MGAAGRINLNHIASSKASAAILSDINPFQTRFWEEIFKIFAIYPEPEDFAKSMLNFAPEFYQTLSQEFNLQALGRLPMEPMRKEDPIFLDDENWVRNTRCHSEASPFDQGTDYGDFAEWFGTHIGWETNFVFTGDPKLDWLRNKDLYRHLHLLGKNRAVGAVTLDITDSDGCRQIREYLDNVRFTPIDAQSGESFAERQGADIGTLYLSNICHYLDWSADKFAQAKKESAALDYTKREVNERTWSQTIENLVPLVDKDSLIIRFDRCVGNPHRPTFYPLFDITQPENIHIPHPLEKGGLIVDIA